MKTTLSILLFLAALLPLSAQSTGIEVNEGTAQESVVTIKRVRSLTIELEHGQSPILTFRKERLKLVNGEVVRAHDAGSVSRDVEAVKAETVQHGGQPVSFQTVMALLKKFHDKWEAEDAAP